MVSLKKYNLKGDAVGEVAVDDSFFDVDASRQMIKDYIVALRANARQWSANTKTKAEVNHTSKKPWRQKGTGNARQGSLASPQFKGGGVVFGPRPKFDQHVRINRKERRLAIRHLLVEKINGGSMIVVEDGAFKKELKKPSTKSVAGFLKSQGINGRRLLFVGEGQFKDGESLPSDTHENFRKSMRNLPKTEYALAANVNGYDVLVAQKMVVTESALAEMVSLLL